MNIINTFLQLTKKTYPYGTEEQLERFLPEGFTKDKHGNYFYEIGKSETAFTCHLDTACKDQVSVTHVFEKNIIKTDGKSILGADDKAGMTVLLYLIQNKIPGLYCFFIGEEVGCIGSGYAAEDINPFQNFKRMISFDRRGTTSVITHQSSKRCCSDDFGKALADALNLGGLSMKIDDTGVYTDSAEFTLIIPECTNISVGYYKEHTLTEHQDIEHLEALCKAAAKVDWESLPTVRDTKDVDYKPYRSWKYSGSNDDGPKSYNTYDDWDTPTSYRETDRYGYTNPHYRGSNYRSADNFYDRVPTKKQKKSRRIYKDDLDNDITEYFKESGVERKKYYETVKQYILNDKLSANDLEKVRDQYLDLNDPMDMDFYLSLKESL